jgi:hypothetical protein
MYQNLASVTMEQNNKSVTALAMQKNVSAATIILDKRS